MATIPDTSDIANALGAIDVSALPSADIAKISAARERLRILHGLGATEEQVNQALRASVRAVEAERDARPTIEEYVARFDRIKELEAELAVYTNPPPKPYTVPIGVFRGKLIGLRLALLTAPENVRAVWAVILPELDFLTEVYPRELPVSDLLALAQSQGLLNAEQVADIRGE